MTRYVLLMVGNKVKNKRWKATKTLKVEADTSVGGVSK
jgi:hypothetical protein